MSESQDVNNPSASDASPGSQRTLVWLGWTSFSFFLLFFFTFIKLPQERIKRYVDGTVTSVLSDNGIHFNAADTQFSYMFGLSYTLKDVTFHFPPPRPEVHLDQINLTPSLLPLLFSRLQSGFEVKNHDGIVSGTVSSYKTKLSLSLKAKRLDLGKIGLPSFLLGGAEASGILNGTASFSGDPNVPETLSGKTDLQLSTVAVASQVILGFSIPKLSISEILMQTVIEQNKLVFKTFQIGKQENAEDDVRGVVTGEVSLGKRWTSSNLDLKVHFSLSENVLKSFVLIGALLGGGKQSDGSYAFQLAGTVGNPAPSSLNVPSSTSAATTAAPSQPTVPAASGLNNSLPTNVVPVGPANGK